MSQVNLSEAGLTHDEGMRQLRSIIAELDEMVTPDIDRALVLMKTAKSIHEQMIDKINKIERVRVELFGEES